MSMRQRLRKAGVAVAAIAVTASLLGAATGGSHAAPASPAGTERLSSGSAAVAGGFALPQGALGRAFAGSDVSRTTGDGGFSEQGGCSYYANNAGMGMYCATGGEDEETLAERFGHLNRVSVCKYFRVPEGMEKPQRDIADDEFWVLEGCLVDINWDTYDGGPGMYIRMGWATAKIDEGIVQPPNQDVVDFLWSEAQSSYPMPLPQVAPSPIPRVNVDAIFHFRWVDGTDPQFPEVAEGPYAGDAGGGPYTEVALNGDVMRAEAVRLRLVPLVEGMKPVTCSDEDPPPFDPDQGDSADAQGSDCYLTFASSSAAAEELSTEPLPQGGEYAFLVRIEVTYQVSVEFDEGGSDDLGSYQMDTIQQLPVNQAPGINYYD